MTITTLNFQQLLATASSNVDSDSLGRLSLARRKAIWVGLGTTENGDQPSGLAKRRCVVIDALCVKKGLPFWFKVFPNDNGPLEMLDLAFAVLAGKVNERDAQSRRDGYFVDVVENRRYDKKDYSALFVGHAAANTVLTAFGDSSDLALCECDDDESLDAEAYEPSYLVASAFAGGLNRSSEANVENRRRFWHWYLSDAIAETLTSETV
jgi:hypothetical protein